MEFEDRLTLRDFDDRGTIIKDKETDITSKVCPFCKAGNCFDDPMDAMDCPQNYQSCRRYQERIKPKEGS